MSDAARTLEPLEVRVLWADVADLPAGGWSHRRLPGDHWRLYQNDALGGTLVSVAGDVPLEPGRIYLLPPSAGLGTRADAPFRQFYVHFDLGGATAAVALGGLAAQSAWRVPESRAFEASVAELGVAVTGGWKGDLALECWMQGVVAEALGRFLCGLAPGLREQYRLRESALRPVLPALRAIHDRYAEPLDNARLAALCHMSEDHFIRRFRDAVGATPARFLARRRLAVATQRLLFTEDSVERIAAEAGFRDRFYFSRVFARAAGTPPAAFRRPGPRP